MYIFYFASRSWPALDKNFLHGLVEEFLSFDDPDYRPSQSMYVRTILFHSLHCSTRSEFLWIASKCLQLGASTNPDGQGICYTTTKKKNVESIPIDFKDHVMKYFEGYETQAKQQWMQLADSKKATKRDDWAHVEAVLQATADPLPLGPGEWQNEVTDMRYSEMQEHFDEPAKQTQRHDEIVEKENERVNSDMSMMTMMMAMRDTMKDMQKTMKDMKNSVEELQGEVEELQGKLRRKRTSEFDDYLSSSSGN